MTHVNGENFRAIPLSDKRIAGLAKHGQSLYDEATGLYGSNGDWMPPYITLSDGTASTELRSHSVNWLESSSQRVINRVRRLGGSVLAGRNISAIHAATWETEPVEFTLREVSSYHRGDRKGNRYQMLMQEAPKRVLDIPDPNERYALPPVELTTEVAGAFMETFMGYTPENILINRRDELSGREQAESYDAMIRAIADMAKGKGRTLKEMSDGGKAHGMNIWYRLSGGARLQVSYRDSHVDSLSMDGTRNPQYSPGVSVWVEHPNHPDNKVHVLAFQLPGGKKSLSSTLIRGLVHEPSATLHHDDTMDLIEVVKQVAELPEYALIGNTMYPVSEEGSVEMLIQAEVPISQDVDRLTRLLTGYSI